MVMFRGRRGSRTADGAAARSAAAGQIVWDAEEIMRQAWAHELLRRQAHLEFAHAAACCDRDTARACLSAAQRDGDPRKISVAHAAFEQALEAARQSSFACDQIRRLLRMELDLPARVAKERTVASVVSRSERDWAATTACREHAPGREAGRTGPVPMVRRLGRRLSRWRFRLVARRTADLQQG